MGLKSQIQRIRKANKILRNEAGKLVAERDSYRQAYNDVLRKQFSAKTGIDVTKLPRT